MTPIQLRMSSDLRQHIGLITKWHATSYGKKQKWIHDEYTLIAGAAAVKQTHPWANSIWSKWNSSRSLGCPEKRNVARIICAQRMCVCDIVYAYIIASRAYHAWANIRAARLGREVNIHNEPRNNEAIINQFIISLTSARVACPLHTRAPRSQMLRTRLLWVLFSYILLEYVVS